MIKTTNMTINIKNLWNFFDGHKTKLGMLALFVYGGLSFVGVELEWLKQLGIWLGFVGLAHSGYKLIK